MRDLLQLRDEFHRHIGEVEGLVSVGFAKTGDGPYLRVVVDRAAGTPAIPSRFRGLPVRVVPGSPAVVAIGTLDRLSG